MRIDWLSTLRHLLQVAAFCCIVAVLTTTIWPSSPYWKQVGNALCIGLITWGIIEFGRYFVDERHCHRSAEGGHGWPMGWRGLLLSAIGIAGGFYIGTALGHQLFGMNNLRSTRDDQIGLVLTIVAGAAATFYFHMRGKASNLLADKNAAERDATEAQLKLLQTQLEPHMLFNTLANLRALIGIDPAAAQQMVDRVNDYLRATLTASRSTEHPLATEFDRLRDYLELMSIRMGARLQYVIELPDELRTHPVPPLILQPLVENAIKHGLEPKVAGGTISVRALRGDSGHVALEVQDSGVGFEPKPLGPTPPSAPGSGFGLAQVRERIATAYKGQGAFSIESKPGVGTTVRIDLPMSGTGQ
ncbi:sensor histidine kinase [Ottowia thiooxydans]|uniref:sensor histidine kinase n=1 Tax=Ottowia thiooxydans TaxID=219182 RepID=UPI00041F1611|nr:histidine kinase [Ottowia thiooxydans]